MGDIQIKLKIGKRHHYYLRTKRLQAWLRTNGVSLIIPLKNDRSDIVTLKGNPEKFANVMDRIVKGISSQAVPYKITPSQIDEDLFCLEPISKRTTENARKTRQAKKKEETTEKTTEEKGRGEECVSDSDSASESRTTPEVIESESE
jgi:hypothetical protein